MKHLSDNRVSRFLSYILRHHPEELELEVDEEAFVPVDQLLANIERIHKIQVSLEQLQRVVSGNDKQRFQFSHSNEMIRAVQGHSFPTGMKFYLVPREEVPEYLYHGTSDSNMQSICMAGLLKMGRNHVHLSADQKTAWKRADKYQGHGCVLAIDARKLVSSGTPLYKSVNGVFLVEFVPPDCIPWYDTKVAVSLHILRLEGVVESDYIDVQVDFTPMPKPEHRS